MRKVTSMLLFAILLFAIPACSKNEDVTLKPGIYTLTGVERDVPGDFTITIYDDGTFESYETPLSSYLGIGRYSIKNNVITLFDDDSERANHYQIEDDKLTFIDDDSSNYNFVPLKEGATFIWTSDIK